MDPTENKKKSFHKTINVFKSASDLGGFIFCDHNYKSVLIVHIKSKLFLIIPIFALIIVSKSQFTTTPVNNSVKSRNLTTL